MFNAHRLYCSNLFTHIYIYLCVYLVTLHVTQVSDHTYAVLCQSTLCSTLHDRLMSEISSLKDHISTLEAELKQLQRERRRFSICHIKDSEEKVNKDE